MYKLIFYEDAEHEYMESFVWYGMQLEGLEERFKNAIDQTLKKIETDPQYFRYCRPPFRKASVKVFPFTIVFKINEPDHPVFIAAVYHVSRWLERKFRNE